MAVGDHLFVNALLRADSPSAFGTIPHEIHKRRRVPVASYFSKTAVYQMQEKIWSNAQHMCDVLQQNWKSQAIVSGRAMFLGWSNDTLRECSFGAKLNLMDSASAAMRFDSVFKAFAKFYPIVKQCSWIIPLALTLPAAPFWYLYEPLAIILDVHFNMIKAAKETIDEHDEKYPKGTKPAIQDNSRTLFHALLSSRLPDIEKKAHRIAHEGFEVLLAGSDTTARTMGIAFYHVVANLNCCAKLRAELETVMPDPTQKADLRVLEGLPYLTAVMNEALRIGKVTDHRLSLIARNEDLHYGQWTIPRGVSLDIVLCRQHKY